MTRRVSTGPASLLPIANTAYQIQGSASRRRYRLGTQSLDSLGIYLLTREDIIKIDCPERMTNSDSMYYCRSVWRISIALPEVDTLTRSSQRNMSLEDDTNDRRPDFEGRYSTG
jgi:hypothetical protein